MSKRTREGTMRLVRAGLLPPIVCGTCGRRFETREQRNAHYGTTASGATYCQH